MINIGVERYKYRVQRSIPENAVEITYEVVIKDELIFQGSTKYNPGIMEIDCADIIESYISKNAISDEEGLTVWVNTHAELDDGTTWEGSNTLYWVADEIDLPYPMGSPARLVLFNCGFWMTSNDPVTIPLVVKNNRLVGKTINKLEKITYMDRYNDIHNGGITNHYEIECYVDPDWLSVTTGHDLDYEKVAIAMQAAKRSSLVVLDGCSVSGLEQDMQVDEEDSDPDPVPTGFTMDVRVKDIERIETYSSYSVEKKIPSYKITIEVFG